MALRGDGLIIMGKNTMMKKVIRNNIQEFPEYEKVLPMLVGNVGFLFTNGDLKAMRDKIAEFKVRAPHEPAPYLRWTSSSSRTTPDSVPTRPRSSSRCKL